jgi:hypothetical protein
MTGFKKRRAAEIQDAIRAVLFNDWDPIGVSDDPRLRGEYDSYIAPIYHILTGSRSEQKLVDCLHGAERDSMGLSGGSTEHLQRIAQTLLALNVK